jgi:hypothetical protein
MACVGNTLSKMNCVERYGFSGDGKLMMNSIIITRTGRHFDILDPDPELINLTDIAAALSKLCRFGGHCMQFYSVAEHCVLTTRLIAENMQDREDLLAWALLHDASEAFIVDIPRPVKRQLPEYQRLEEVIQRAIAERFNLPWPIPDEVYQADNDMLIMEMESYMLKDSLHSLQHTPRYTLIDGLPSTPLDPMSAESLFLASASSLKLDK